jgi:hypothetical protein
VTKSSSILFVGGGGTVRGFYGCRNHRMSIDPVPMALNLGLGWVDGDDLRVLIAAGLPVSGYSISRIQGDMNTLGEMTPGAVSVVRGLLTQYEVMQSSIASLNSSSKGKVLVKADVLEWEADGANAFGPYQEVSRIRGLLGQYFGFSLLFGEADGIGGYTGNVYITRA